MLKDLLFALDLAIRVIGTFVIGIFVGRQLDLYFHTKVIFLIICIVFVFVYVMKILLGVGKHE